MRSSYDPADVEFLLTPIALAPTDVAEKERLIQSGARHYSEMISRERRPDPRYLALYEDALDRGAARIAREVAGLAARIALWVREGRLAPEVTLCSLVRAGVPYGVVLRRALAGRGVDVAHYGVSIVRGRGLDAAAMAHVLARRPEGGILFVDGWTGKGAIAGELAAAWPGARLAVLADPGGHAALAGSHEDWLIPSGLLGANVSGLVSRSILRPDLTGPDAFHGAVAVDHLADIDRTRDFVDRIAALMPEDPPPTPEPEGQAERRALAQAAVNAIAERHGVTNLNRIKPGIAEATRAVLRRRPERVFLRAEDDPDLAALVHLCEADGVPAEVRDTGPYRAITLIGAAA